MHRDLLQQAFGHAGFRRADLTDEFHGDVDVEPEVMGNPNFTHAARAEWAKQLVLVVDDSARRVHHAPT